MKSHRPDIADHCSAMISASTATENPTIVIIPKQNPKPSAKALLKEVADAYYTLAAINNTTVRVGPKFEEAAKQYRNRRDRITHPEGKADKGGRWYPDISEGLDTSQLRSPSRSWPWPYMRACRTFKHCCNKQELSEPERKQARKLAKLLDSALPDAVENLEKNGFPPPPEILAMIP